MTLGESDQRKNLHANVPFRVPPPILYSNNGSNTNKELYLKWMLLIDEIHRTDVRALLKPHNQAAKQLSKIELQHKK